MTDDNPYPLTDDYYMYHACVSWTYVTADRAEEALLRIRKELKVAAGWWDDGEEQQWQAAMDKLGVPS